MKLPQTFWALFLADFFSKSVISNKLDGRGWGGEKSLRKELQTPSRNDRLVSTYSRVKSMNYSYFLAN